MEFKRIPIIKLGRNLLISIQVELDDLLVLKLQNDICQEIMKTGSIGVLLDVSAIEIMDSYIARVINDIGKNARIMGARTVLVGLQPAIAITLVEMGMEMDSVETALNLDIGLDLINNGEEKLSNEANPTEDKQPGPPNSEEDM